MEHAEIEPILRDLFAVQRYAVLGTQGAQRVTLNLMAVAVSDDLRSLILVTDRATPKYANLRRNPQVSLLVDNRANQAADTQTALALTIDGLAEEVTGAEREQPAERFVARHPQLESLVHSPTCALFRIRVKRYELVRGLYDVREVWLS
jgi:heme iron utilization protein